MIWRYWFAAVVILSAIGAMISTAAAAPPMPGPIQSEPAFEFAEVCGGHATIARPNVGVGAPYAFALLRL